MIFAYNPRSVGIIIDFKMNTIKAKLYKFCMDYVQNRIATMQKAIDEAKEAGNDETKSSAGDKHETGRAMAQLDQEKNSKHLQEAILLKHTLEKLNWEQRADKVMPGSLVITNKGNFYIAIPAGKLMVDNIQYFAVSPAAPIAQAMMGLKAKVELEFNGEVIYISSIG
jgi:hypothetical protein